MVLKSGSTGLFPGVPGQKATVFPPCPEPLPSKALKATGTIPDSFTVTGVGFVGESDYRVKYQFTPGITGEGLTYQITFTDLDGKLRLSLHSPNGGFEYARFLHIKEDGDFIKSI